MCRLLSGAGAALVLPLLLAPAALAQPVPDRIHALQGGTARLSLPAGEGWEVRDEAGGTLVAAGSGGAVQVPPGGWYRLFRRDAAGRAEPVGGRFAAGHVILVTGQSQAASLFRGDWPAVGAHPPGRRDPPAPPVSAVLEGCAGAPGCPPAGLRWAPPGEALGVRILLAELARLRPGIPVALVDAAWGEAGIADLLDPAQPGHRKLAAAARAAAPASALLVLGHGTTDAQRGTAPEAYVAGMGELVALLRRLGGDPAMPALLAPLPPLTDAVSVLGSGRLAGWLGLSAADAWARRLGLARRRPADPALLAHAAAIRAAQAEAAHRFGLLPGGDMAAVATGADGLHWSPDGVRRAAREAAAALAAHLPQP